MGLLYDPKGTHVTVDGRVARAAATQHGLITRSQALSLGLSPGAIKWRLASGRWVPVRPSVYRVGGAPPTFRQQILSACLWLGPKAAASHRTALALVLGTAGERPIHVTIPFGRFRPAGESLVVHRTRRPLLPADRATIDGIPATSPIRALVDAAATEPLEQLQDILERLLRAKIVSLQTLRRRLQSAGRLPGAPALRRLIDARAGGTESGFEARLLPLIVAAGLPRPVQQYRIRHQGRLVARVDFAYPRQRVAIEADGFEFHDTRRTFDDERARGNDLLAIGWDVLRVTRAHLDRDTDAVIAWLCAALARR